MPLLSSSSSSLLLFSCCSSVAAISSQDDLSSSSALREKLIQAITDASSNNNNNNNSNNNKNRKSSNNKTNQSPLALLEKLLLHHPPEVLLVPNNRTGNTPLHQVCRLRPLPRYEVMHLLVTRAPPGALSQTNHAQQTPLHWLVAAVVSSNSCCSHHNNNNSSSSSSGTPRWTFHQSSSSYHCSNSWHPTWNNHHTNNSDSGDNQNKPTNYRQQQQQQQQQQQLSNLQQLSSNHHHPVTALIHLFLQYSGGSGSPPPRSNPVSYSNIHHNHTTSTSTTINAASITDVNGFTPLHVACSSSNLPSTTTATSAIQRDWIQRLIRAYPPALQLPSTNHGSTPLHYASACWTSWSSASAAAVPVLDVLVWEYPLACLRQNHKGWLPVEEVAAAARQPLWSVSVSVSSSSVRHRHQSLHHPVVHYMTQVTIEAVQALMDTLCHAPVFQATTTAPAANSTTTTDATCLSGRNMIFQQQLQSWYTSASLTQTLDLPALKQLLDEYHQDILQPLLFGPHENDSANNHHHHHHNHHTNERQRCLRHSPRSFHWLFVALFRMNRVGRLDYLAHDPSNRVRGVHVLGEIPHSLDGLWVHVRENPALCNRSRIRMVDPALE